MSLQELVRDVNYISDSQGRTTSVQLDVNLWQQILMILEQSLEQEGPIESNGLGADSGNGWEVFLSLADDAQPGVMENPSLQHDAYLYGHFANSIKFLDSRE
jgi:hypothetical protein